MQPIWFLALIFIILFPSRAIQCPDGWIQYTLDQHKCFLIVAQRMDWFSAESYCNNAYPGAHLTSVCSGFENRFIDAKIANSGANDRVWIGLNNLNRPDHFEWIDNAGPSCPYRNWAPGQPDNVSRNQCVISLANTGNGKWSTEDCAAYNYFVCDVFGATSNTEASTPTTTTRMSSTTRQTVTHTLSTTTFPPPQTTTTQMPPSTTPLPQCNLKNTAADLVVLFDSSNGLPGDEFKAMVLDFIQFAQLVNFGGDYVRVAMGTYDQQSYFNGDFLSLNSSADYTNKVFSIWRQPQTGIYGNNIDGALRHVVNLTTSDHGYRQGGNVVDLTVIISSTAWDTGNFGNGFADPSNTAATLRRASMNIIAIGVGPNANMQQLLQISPCAQYVPNGQELVNLMPWIWSRLCLTGEFC